MALGHTNEDIGRAMGLSANTVRNHLARIYPRLGASNRADLVRLALFALLPLCLGTLQLALLLAENHHIDHAEFLATRHAAMSQGDLDAARRQLRRVVGRCEGRRVRPSYYALLGTSAEGRRTLKRAPPRGRFSPTIEPPSRSTEWRPGDSAADVIARFTDLSPALTPTLVNAILPAQYPDVDGKCGTWGEMFWDTSRRGRVASTAMGIPLDRAREAVEALFDVNEAHTAPALFALRYVKASDATLAFTRHAPHTAVLEIDGPYSRGMLAFYEAAWERVRGLGFPVTFHWGKMLPLDDTLPTQAYGADRVRAWTDARHTLLPTAELRKVFTNDMLHRLGLDV